MTYNVLSGTLNPTQSISAVGCRKGIQPVKTEWWGTGVIICLEQGAIICIWSSWCHCHPIISCFIKIQNGLTFLVPAYSGCLGKEAIKWMSVCCDTITASVLMAIFVANLGCPVPTRFSSLACSWRVLMWTSHGASTSTCWQFAFGAIRICSV